MRRLFRLIVFDLDGTLVDSKRDIAESANATLVACGAPSLPEDAIGRMVGDGAPTLIARALTNLVEHAVQAMPNGGALRVTAAAENGTVNLTFADTGVGMDAAAAARAFEPYFSTKTAGSGLGLANARRNIETCGGSIALTSIPGRGTSVIITLPTAVPAAAHEAGSTPDR